MRKTVIHGPELEDGNERSYGNNLQMRAIQIALGVERLAWLIIGMFRLILIINTSEALQFCNFNYICIRWRCRHSCSRRKPLDVWEFCCEHFLWLLQFYFFIYLFSFEHALSTRFHVATRWAKEAELFLVIFADNNLQLKNFLTGVLSYVYILGCILFLETLCFKKRFWVKENYNFF